MILMELQRPSGVYSHVIQLGARDVANSISSFAISPHGDAEVLTIIPDNNFMRQ